MKKCPKCGQTKNKSDFNKEQTRFDGLSIYCKACHNEDGQAQYTKNPKDRVIQTEIYRKSHPELYRVASKKFRDNTDNKKPLKIYHKNYRQTPEGKYSSYKNNAKAKNRSFNLTFDEFMSFWQQPCFYCNSNIETVGLDRVNNEIGYEIGNIISCCEVCNSMKSSLTQQQFIEYCIKIAEHRQVKTY